MAEMSAVDLDDLVLRHLDASFAELHPHQTIERAIASIRSQALHDRIVYFYVIDDDRRLHGVISTRHLLMADPSERVASMMRADVVTLPVTATLRDAVDLFVAHGLLALPVVASTGRMQGVVDVAAIGADRAAVTHRRHANELFEMLGMHVSGRRRGAGERFGALSWTIAGGLVAAAITAAHATLVSAVMALALFMPVALALSESIGMQAVALAIGRRGSGGARSRALLRSASREAATAAGLATGCAAVVGGIAAIWEHDFRFGAVVFVAITLAMVVAATVGTIVPAAVRRLRRDPHAAAGPAVLAIADFVTLLLYFRLAALFLE